MSMQWGRACIVTIASIGLWQLSAGLYIHAKAWLAQELIAASWTATIAGSREVRPWPWADTWPVARLQVPSAEVDVFVLADASGRSLAFGPGVLSGSAELGSDGNTVIAAHRDTHFSFLKDLKPGSRIEIQTVDGRTFHYRVLEPRVIDTRVDHLSFHSPHPTLSLVTCYPFDSIEPGGPLRYVAIAEQVSIAEQVPRTNHFDDSSSPLRAEAGQLIHLARDFVIPTESLDLSWLGPIYTPMPSETMAF